MDGVGPAPAPALAASSATPPRGFRISNAGVSGLTAASLILLLVYLGGRFLWNYRKEAAASSAAQASSPQPGSSGVAVSLLPVFVHVDAETTSECAVCLAEFADGEAGRRLPRCGHGFHEACIETWLRINTTCPLCRAPVAANEPVMR